MQTSVTTQAATQAGVIATLEPGGKISATSEEASAEIPFGVLVVQGTADAGAVLPTGEDDPLGVVILAHNYSADHDIGADGGLLPETVFAVLRSGEIWVQVEDAVGPGDPVRVRTVAAGAEQLGAFRTAADTTDCAVLSDCRFMTSAGAGGFARLELRLNGDSTLTQDT